MFKGSIPALVTPFSEDGSLDEAAFAELVEWQIAEGSHALVPMGTTGESPTLTHDEHKRVVELCIEVANKRVPVIAGAGSNNTLETIDLCQFGEKQGADGLLIVAPYYNKPNQRGLYAHFSAAAKATSLPIILYNIPGRSIIDILPETMAQLHKDFPSIVGVKDATGKIERISEQRLVAGADFIQLSGEDATALAVMAHGGHGCISVTANVAPALCASMQESCMNGDYKTALEIQDRLMPLHKALFVEPNPCGAKYALSLLGKMTETVRSPLVPLSDETKKLIRDALVYAGLLN